MKTKKAWLGIGVWLTAAIAFGAKGLWLGDDDRVAVVAKSAGTEWAEASGVLLDCAELEIPLVVFQGVLTAAERESERQAFTGIKGAVTETGAGFESLGEQLADFDPSHVILTGWKAREGVPPSVAAALEETPAMILRTVASRGDYSVSLADFQREVRNVILPVFGLPPSPKGTDHFRQVEAEDIAVAEAEEELVAEEEPAFVATEAVSAFAEAREEPSAAKTGRGGPAGKDASKLKPRTKLPDAPKPNAWFNTPASW